MKKLKIAHIFADPNVEKGGGIARFLQNLLLFFDKNQSDNFIIAHTCDQVTRNKLTDMGVTVYSIFDETTTKTIDPITTLKWLKQTIKNIQPDIVNTHNHWGDVYGRNAARSSNVPIIITREANIILDETSQYKTNKYRLENITDAVICVSNAVKNYAHTLDKIPENKLRVIYNGLNLREYPFKFEPSQHSNPPYQGGIKGGSKTENNRPQPPLSRGENEQFDPPLPPLSRGEFKFVFVARLDPQKVPSRVINAINILNQKGYDCHLSIIGDGSLKTECEQQVKQLKLTDKIKFLGYQENPWQLVNLDSIFVMTSDFEGFGQTIIEAMASGILCVLPTLEPVLEIANNNEEAIFYQAGNQEDLEAKMELALNLSSEQKIKIIYQARTRVEHCFDAQIMANNYLNLYQELYQKKVL